MLNTGQCPCTFKEVLMTSGVTFVRGVKYMFTRPSLHNIVKPAQRETGLESGGLWADDGGLS